MAIRFCGSVRTFYRSVLPIIRRAGILGLSMSGDSEEIQRMIDVFTSREEIGPAARAQKSGGISRKLLDRALLGAGAPQFDKKQQGRAREFVLQEPGPKRS